MFIQSKFRDYYDNFISPENRDPKIVYKRETSEKEIQKVSLWNFLRSSDLIFGTGNSHYVQVVLFCGKLYPFGLTISNDFHLPEKDRKKIDYKNPYAEFQTKRYMTSSKEAGIGADHPEALELNRTLAPILLLRHNGRFILNPCLKDLQFPMHGAQVIQTLMGFLSAQDPETVEIADKYRIPAHGFDKTSFRKDKGGPTRKRKKIQA